MRGKDVVAVFTDPCSTSTSKKSSPAAGAPGLLGSKGISIPTPSSSSVLLMLSKLLDRKDQPSRATASGCSPSMLLSASLLLLLVLTAAAAAVTSPAAASASRFAAVGAVSFRHCVSSGRQVTEKVGTAPAGGPAFAAPAQHRRNRQIHRQLICR
jgi:hypothetical protein